MDWKTIRKDRLAKGSWDGKGRARISLRISRIIDAWRRAWILSWWGKGIAVGVGIVLVIGAVFSYVAISGAGGDGPAEAVLSGGASATAAPATAAPATAAPATAAPATAAPATAEPTPEAPTPKPRPTAKPAVVRTNCNEIAGTPYESSEERDWYLENCLGGTLVENPPPEPSPAAPAAPIPTSSSAPPASAPEPTPTTAAPAGGFDAEDAVAMALELIAADGPAGEIGLCSAVRTSAAQWSAWCDVGGTNVSVCIIEAPRTAWFC